MKKKFIIVSFVFMLLLFMFMINNNVYADSPTDYSFKYNGNEYTFPNFPFLNNSFLILNNYTNGKEPESIADFQVRVFEGNLENGVKCSPYIYWQEGNGWNNSFVSYTESDGNISVVNSTCTFSVYHWNGSSYVKDFTGEYCNFDEDGKKYEKENNYTNVFVTARPNCILGDSRGQVSVENIKEPFFHLAPVTTLAEVLTPEEGQKTIAEVVGILPLILVVVVSFLGLRKALSWLLTLLRHS